MPIRIPAPPPPAPPPKDPCAPLRAERDALRAERDRLRRVVAAVQAEVAEPGAVTKTELRGALATK